MTIADMRSGRLLRIVYSLLFWVALVPAAIATEPVYLEVDPAPLTIVSDTGQVRAKFQVEIADEAGERMTGLMFRPPLADDEAMLFIFEAERMVSMWMRNTPSPLDMIFAREDGTIARIAPSTTPFSSEIISSGVPVKYVLEVRAGLSDALGIAISDGLQHPTIADNDN